MSNTNFTKVSNTNVEQGVNSTITAVNNSDVEYKAINYSHILAADGGTITVTNPGLNTWAQATGSLFTDHHSSNITIGTDTITLTRSGLYVINVTLFMGISTATLNTIELGIGINGSNPTFVVASGRPFSVTIPANAAGSVIDPFDSGDILRLYARNIEAGSGNTLILSGNISIHQIGNEY